MSGTQAPAWQRCPAPHDWRDAGYWQMPVDTSHCPGVSQDNTVCVDSQVAGGGGPHTTPRQGSPMHAPPAQPLGQVTSDDE